MAAAVPCVPSHNHEEQVGGGRERRPWSKKGRLLPRPRPRSSSSSSSRGGGGGGDGGGDGINIPSDHRPWPLLPCWQRRRLLPWPPSSRGWRVEIEVVIVEIPGPEPPQVVRGAAGLVLVCFNWCRRFVDRVGQSVRAVMACEQGERTRLDEDGAERAGEDEEEGGGRGVHGWEGEEAVWVGVDGFDGTGTTVSQ